MKPVAFDYERPARLGTALRLLAERGEDAKILAGGQSLIPLLNFRLARPGLLVDVNRLDELAYVLRRDGKLLIGALARTSALERSPLVGARWPLLQEAVRLVGHPQIRSRGTVGGSVAHADPAAELPAALLALDACFAVRSERRARVVPSSDLFVSQLTTSLEPDELLTCIEVPALPPRSGTAFIEYSRTHGDFALAGTAVVIVLAEDGACERASVALCAAAPTPVRATGAEAVLAGARVDAAVAAEAGRLAADAVDVPASQRLYRQALVAELVRRAVLTAAERAAEAA